MKKILVIRNDNIGDLACTTPLLEVLRKAYPSAMIDVLGNSYNVALLQHDPRVSHVWHYDKAKHFPSIRKKVAAWIQKFLLLVQLRLQRYDIAIIAVPIFNRRTTQIANFIHPKIICGAETTERPLPRNYHAIKINHTDEHVLQVVTYAKALGIDDPAPDGMVLFLSAKEKTQVERERAAVPGDQSKPIIGVQISARRPKQRYSFEQWEKMINLLLPHARLRILWSPGLPDHPQHPGDDLLAAELQAAFPKDQLLVQPTTDVRSLMVAFASCDLVVGSDGGAMHIAAALGPKTVTLFGDIDPSVWRPYSKRGYEIASPTGNLSDVAPEVVAKKVIELLLFL
ncbi:MAG: glycosyltransferase family 9 protein [Chthoniobacterales bacterium]